MPTVGAAVYTSVASCAQRIRVHMPTVAVKVQTCWTFKASSGIPATQENAPRSLRADALFCMGTEADVYQRICSSVYTLIHSATCAMQWQRPGSHKRGHLRRLPVHTRAWSINPALPEPILPTFMSPYGITRPQWDKDHVHMVVMFITILHEISCHWKLSVPSMAMLSSLVALKFVIVTTWRCHQWWQPR